jgi:Sulfotransferase family
MPQIEELRLSLNSIKLALGQQYSAWTALPRKMAALSRSSGGRTVLVTGAYRSGTSWVGQMLAGPGVWHLHEPFNPHQGIWSEYFSYRRSSQSYSKLDEMIAALNSGEFIGLPDHIFLRGIAANRRGMPARVGLYKNAVRRVLIKDPIACLLSEYLVRNHGMTAVLVLRHPAGFANSLSELGWDTAAQLANLLRNEELMEDWLHPYEDIMKQHSKKSNMESHTTLLASLWTVMYGFAQRNDNFLIVNYEELCDAPEAEFEKLYQKLNLPLLEEDRQRHASLTQGRKPSEVLSPFDVVRDTKSTQKSWSRKLSEHDIESIRAIWNVFSMPVFQSDEDW